MMLDKTVSLAEDPPEPHSIQVRDPGEWLEPGTLQHCVWQWTREAFVSMDRIEHNHRFLREALELVQACGTTQDEARRSVEYVFSRPAGEIRQEVGGAVIMLAALCTAQNQNMYEAADEERRGWKDIDKIRAKQAAKPHGSPLPGPSAPQAPRADDVLARLQVMAHQYQDAGRIGESLENDLIQLMQSVLPKLTLEEAAAQFLKAWDFGPPDRYGEEMVHFVRQLREAMV